MANQVTTISSSTMTTAANVSTTSEAVANQQKYHPQQADLKLLDISLKHAGAIITSVMGEFTSPSQQEIVLLRAGGTMELYRIMESSSSADHDDEDDDEEESRTWLKLVTRVETRSVLRSMVAVRLSGEKRDVIVLGADGGCLSVIDLEGGKENVLHCPVFGKTGTFTVIYFFSRRIFQMLVVCSC